MFELFSFQDTGCTSGSVGVYDHKSAPAQMQLDDPLDIDRYWLKVCNVDWGIEPTSVS